MYYQVGNMFYITILQFLFIWSRYLSIAAHRYLPNS